MCRWKIWGSINWWRKCFLGWHGERRPTGFTKWHMWGQRFRVFRIWQSSKILWKLDWSMDQWATHIMKSDTPWSICGLWCPVTTSRFHRPLDTIYPTLMMALKSFWIWQTTDCDISNTDILACHLSPVPLIYIFDTCVKLLPLPSTHYTAAQWGQNVASAVVSGGPANTGRGQQWFCVEITSGACVARMTMTIHLWSLEAMTGQNGKVAANQGCKSTQKALRGTPRLSSHQY